MENLHPSDMIHGKPGMPGTNQGRIAVPVASVGEDPLEGNARSKGKARVEMGVPVKLAMEQQKEEGGYNGR
jgi:hypothetical protein